MPLANISIVWFRLDLRLADNPALRAAVETSDAVAPLFVWAPEEEAPWQPGAASKWWLHQSLQSLQTQLQAIGSRLLIARGPSAQTLLRLAKDLGAHRIFWNRRYEPALRARDEQVADILRANTIETNTFNSAQLHEPWTIQNHNGRPFQVFTPFWKHCQSQPQPAAPLPPPDQIPAPKKWPKSLPLASLQLEPRIDWAKGLRETWRPGEPGAQARLAKFLAGISSDYATSRNHPAEAGTSRLSPHLHFGEIGPRQIWHAIQRSANKDNAVFLKELGWREFAYHLLYHFPHTTFKPLRPEFNQFPWRADPAFLKAWQRGQTGYPIVDAGMRELWATGWMHNRVRMIVASFLVKDLLISWTDGARWFWDTLVDADLANNTLGWQWSAGCGADAAPYFRIFNPAKQAETFDPDGNYMRRWCPELAGPAYPPPIVNHRIAREVALEAFGKIKRK